MPKADPELRSAMNASLGVITVGPSVWASRERRVLRPAQPLAMGREIFDVLIDEVAKCGLDRRLFADWMFAPVDTAFRLADPGVCIPLYDKGLASDVAFTSYLSFPLAIRPPVN